jgi:hypothetical protein
MMIATNTMTSINAYRNFTATGLNGGRPMYGWGMDDLRTITSDVTTLESVLDIINVVPNPYYAYSTYETGRIDNRVRITNLPNKCKIKIFTLGNHIL